MKTLKIIYSLLIASLVMSCNTEEVQELSIPTDIRISQIFGYKNSSGEDLFQKGVYKAEQLSLIATDENWQPLLTNKGKIFADIEGRAEILFLHQGDLGLLLGHVSFIDEENNLAIGYFKLKYDENKYDKIKVYYYMNWKEGNYHYITKIIYNGVEYSYGDMPIVIQKEE